jgi:hypothetical protein
MRCKKFDVMTSSYLDQQLSAGEAVGYRGHLASCADCRAHLDEVAQVSQMLRDVRRPDLPRELHGYIMTAVEQRAANEISFAERAVGWMARFNPRFVSYVTGALVSAVLFTAMLAALRPIPVIGADGRPKGEVYVIAGPAITSSDIEYDAYNDLPPDATLSDAHYYQLPRMLDNSALVSFSRIAAPGPEGIAALVEISVDGRAQLVDVLNAPRDPYLVEQLWWSLSKRTFQPAMVGGRPVPTRIILLVEKVDVTG